jgi:hypothetical protein
VETKLKVELAIDVALAGVLVFYILSLNPTTVVYLRNYAAGLRWWLWTVSNPEWLKEALQVRGFIS